MKMVKVAAAIVGLCVLLGGVIVGSLNAMDNKIDIQQGPVKESLARIESDLSDIAVEVREIRDKVITLEAKREK